MTSLLVIHLDCSDCAMPRYSIDIIGKKMRHLGTVEAASDKAAVEEAMKQFGIGPGVAGEDRGDESE